MSIDYVCDLDTDASIPEIASRVQVLIGGTLTTEEEQIMVVTNAIFANIRAIHRSPHQGMVPPGLGNRPANRNFFQPERFGAGGRSLAGRRDFTLASVKLGEDLDADVLLSFETERAIMRRQNGALTLYDWWPDWTNPEVMARLSSGYTLVSDGQEQESDD